MKFAVLTLLASLSIGSAAAADAPKNPCNRPVVPNSQASDMVMKAFNKHMETYKTCISDFVAERKAFAEHTKDSAAANEAHDAAEAAIADFNDQIKELNERNKAAGMGDEDESK
ncbi:MAG TPA: hypothetical protein VK832_11150 [Burkholderiaceae bacterium]|nr:hypothetical protein [Burkholderiaceae bacterium]